MDGIEVCWKSDLIRGLRDGVAIRVVPQAAHDEGDDQHLPDSEGGPHLVATLFEPAGHEEAELLGPAGIPRALGRQKHALALRGRREGEELILDCGH